MKWCVSLVNIVKCLVTWFYVSFRSKNLSRLGCKRLPKLLTKERQVLKLLFKKIVHGLRAPSSYGCTAVSGDSTGGKRIRVDRDV